MLNQEMKRCALSRGTKTYTKIGIISLSAQKRGSLAVDSIN